MSLSGSRVQTQSDFLSSSQLTAMRPQLNSTVGPTLMLMSEFPPTYKTVYPVALTSNVEQIVTITLLSHDASLAYCKVTALGNLIANCDPLLERLDLEAYAAKIRVTGSTYGLPMCTGKVILEVNMGTSSTRVEIDCDIVQTYVPPPPPYIPPPPANPFVVPVNVQQSPVVSPIHRSLGGSGLAGSGRYGYGSGLGGSGMM